MEIYRVLQLKISNSQIFAFIIDTFLKTIPLKFHKYISSKFCKSFIKANLPNFLIDYIAYNGVEVSTYSTVCRKN